MLSTGLTETRSSEEKNTTLNKRRERLPILLELPLKPLPSLETPFLLLTLLKMLNSAKKVKIPNRTNVFSKKTSLPNKSKKMRASMKKNKTKKMKRLRKNPLVLLMLIPRILMLLLLP